jgi:pilus assembly protein CpaE
MPALLGQIVTVDEQFRRDMASRLRASPEPVSIAEGSAARPGTHADVIVVDVRGDVAAGLSEIERIRAASPGASIFAAADAVDPSLILAAMRAGANEFFAWPGDDSTIDEGLRRAGSRVRATSGRAQASVVIFVGAKGGVGTTTLAVNTAVDLARIGGKSTVILDLKPGLGEVALFLGLRCRYTLLDALDNVHRLDDEFLRELLAHHKSGLDLLAGSDQFDRPGAGDGAAVEEVVRLLSRHYDQIVIDAGMQLGGAVASTLYGADHICLVANPDVASVRNSQRILDRIRQLGPCGERVRVLLNRAAEPYPIPPPQIETAIGHAIDHMFPSDYRTVAGALNAGVPLALSTNGDLSAGFERFTRSLLPVEAVTPPAGGRRSGLGFQRLASLW